MLRGVASQSANLQEWQNSAGTVLTSVSSLGGVVAPTFNTSASMVSLGEGAGGGLMRLLRITSTPSAPGTNYGRLYFKAGTTGLALFVMGPTGTEVRIADNIT